jgi:hypothetical protein
MIVTAAVVVALALATAVATDTLRFGGSARPSLARTVEASPSYSATTSTSDPFNPCRSDLTVDNPLRLWVGGDSLAGSLGPALGSITGATGVVQPYFHSRVSSGLSNPGFVDWPAQATKEMTTYSPDVVVFIIGTNDYPATMTSTTDPSTGDYAWKTTYAKEVEQMLEILIGQGRTVWWLGAPVLKDPTQNAAIKEINAVAKDVVKRHPEAQWFDTYSFFADTDGKYTPTLPGADGKIVQVRAGDGVHFTEDGATMLATALFKEVDGECHITAQAVTGVTKQTIQTPGSTQVIGGTSGGSGSGSGSGGSIVTSPPATAAPSTAPPAPATTHPSVVTEPPTTSPVPPPSTAPTATTSKSGT